MHTHLNRKCNCSLKVMSSYRGIHLASLTEPGFLCSNLLNKAQNLTPIPNSCEVLPELKLECDAHICVLLRLVAVIPIK